MNGGSTKNLSNLRTMVDSYSYTTPVETLEQGQQEIETFYRHAQEPEKGESLRLLHQVTSLKHHRKSTTADPGAGADVDRDAEELLARARRQLEYGTVEMMPEVVTLIGDVLLTHSVTNEQTNVAAGILRSLYQRNPAMESDISNLLDRLPRSLRSTELDALRRQLRGNDGGGATNGHTPEDRSLQAANVDAILADADIKYYEGEYILAAPLYRKVLQIDRNNLHAQQYLERCDYNIQNNVVPDRRIPGQARDRYNRARSLVNGRNFAQAKKFCQEALNTFRASTDMAVWPDAESLLQRIEEYLDAENEVQMGREALDNGKWDEARQHYENALRLDPSHSEAIQMVSPLRQIREALAKTQRAFLRQGSPSSLVPLLLDAREGLTQVLAELPNNSVLADTLQDIDSRLVAAQDSVRKQADMLIEQATKSKAGLEDRLDKLNQAIATYDEALKIGFDEELRMQREAATRQRSELSPILDHLKEAENLLAQGQTEALRRAYIILEMLKKNRASDAQIAQDAFYLSLVSTLQQRLIGVAETTLDQGDLPRSQVWLKQATMPFFNETVGRQTYVVDVKNRLETARRAMLLRTVGMAAGVVILLAAAAFSTRTMWGDIISPPTSPPTQTPFVADASMSSAASVAAAFDVATSTPVPTTAMLVLATDTATAIPTATPTPTATSEPSPAPTSTPAPLVCGSAVSQQWVKLQPQDASENIGFVKAAQQLCVWRTERDKEGVLWYFIRYGTEDLVQEGWLAARFVEEDRAVPSP